MCAHHIEIAEENITTRSAGFLCQMPGPGQRRVSISCKINSASRTRQSSPGHGPMERRAVFTRRCHFRPSKDGLPENQGGDLSLLFAGRVVPSSASTRDLCSHRIHAMSTAIRLPCRPSTIRDNVSGTAVSDRDPPIRDFFPKSWKVFSENRGMNTNSKCACLCQPVSWNTPAPRARRCSR